MHIIPARFYIYTKAHQQGNLNNQIAAMQTLKL
jgi:hypothetical protein